MLKIEIIGGEEVARRLSAIEPKVHGSLLSTITKLSFELQAKVVSEKLSGQVLKTKTGTLRRSITTRIEDTPTRISGRVGTNVAYGLMHEFGFKGIVSVKEHLRKITKAWGRAIKPKSVIVSAHSRNANYPVRSFLRSALREMTPQIQAEIDKALKI